MSFRNPSLPVCASLQPSPLHKIPHHLQKYQDFVPGRAIRPQLALGTASPAYAVRRMQGSDGAPRPFVVETKFDGERIQIHRTAAGEHLYFSRRAIEHGDRSNYRVFDPVLTAQIQAPQFILDGEMVVWSKARRRFEPFGGLKSTVQAAAAGSPGSQRLEVRDWEGTRLEELDDSYSPPLLQDVELVFVAFDVVYLDDRPVAHLPLSERQRLLARLLADHAEPVPIPGSPICGRVVPLIPGSTRFGDALVSQVAETADQVRACLESAAALKDEGVVLKALDAPWVSNDRSGSWIKIKLDYVRNVDIDAVVLGGWYGAGRRGDQLSQFLLGLAVPSNVPGEAASRWITFARVGTGLSDDERAAVNAHLKESLRPHTPPSVEATGRERPDAWVADPARSLVLEIHADLRALLSNNYATRYSLRFPAVHAIRREGLRRRWLVGGVAARVE